MADFDLILGSVTFQGMEVPEEIPFGGEQALSVKKMIGGARTVDSMGPDDSDIVWSGRFQGENALDRALLVDQMRRSGQQVTLTFAGLSYTVVVRRFDARLQRVYQLPYSITLLVVQDNTTPAVQSSATLDDLVSADMDQVSTLLPSVTDTTVAPAISGLSSAIAAVGTLQGATLTALAPVATAAQFASTTLATAITNCDATILSNTGSVAGVVGGGFAPTLIANFNAQVAAISQQSALLQVSALVNRVATNVAQATG